MDIQEWYLEYQIHKNRPGLLGDISSILGMMNINILTLNGVENRRRGMLLQTDDYEKIDALRELLNRVDEVTVTALRNPTIIDRLAIRHGRYIDRCSDDRRTFRFIRNELGLLVDFLAELLKKDGHQLIGIRGMPRVGKTESIVASSVCASKRWTFVSSTLLRQTVRRQLAADEMSQDHVYIIDGIVSAMRGTEEHQALVREILRRPVSKVVEHPDVFVRETEYALDDFDYIVELRSEPHEEITYDALNAGFSSFDIS
ncbi:DUF3388 domain-containing protein [Numidum massiliense]|uniref:DUF3388 domain-containing protein n=1 Tax=Numidum massiliense TaxID=1522315 RepID=UPI0006D55EFE|nr:DUF3388 domain-containing protein [Numidum massiliense]